ncbi:hypothetical protein K5Q02_03020 [Pseudomonas sp. MM211]|uniref:hypothetical protein n=1 Tax=Pseudomonas sp. MM211 TaxID=2866808 RepID=UPI001CECB77A|nr:hypothetical protein [Pseudomonas sp. MM211]UCJ17372.1 hypothetical protein K5Q02_03020 [Pseudomonas sp. MM211]
MTSLATARRVAAREGGYKKTPAAREPHGIWLSALSKQLIHSHAHSICAQAIGAGETVARSLRLSRERPWKGLLGDPFERSMDKKPTNACSARDSGRLAVIQQFIHRRMHSICVQIVVFAEYGGLRCSLP